VLVGERFERFFVRRRLAARRLEGNRQLEFVVQQLLQLLGRIQAEMPPGQFECALLQFEHAPAEFLALRAQLVDVDQHAGLFHARKHRHERHLDRLEHRTQLRLAFELRPQRVMQAQRNVGVLGRIVGRTLHVDLRERDLPGALAGDVLVADRLDAEVLVRQRVHVVAAAGRIPHVGLEHRIVAHAAYGDAIGGQHVHVVLEMLSQFIFFRLFQNRQAPQARRHDAAVPARRHSHAQTARGGATGLDRECNADDVSAHRIQGSSSRSRTRSIPPSAVAPATRRSAAASAPGRNAFREPADACPETSAREPSLQGEGWVGMVFARC
jgi:hypothetical protein